MNGPLTYPIYHAIIHRKVDIVRLLLERGGDLGIEFQDGHIVGLDMDSRELAPYRIYTIEKHALHGGKEFGMLKSVIRSMLPQGILKVLDAAKDIKLRRWKLS
jgi:hypothetical protein